MAPVTETPAATPASPGSTAAGPANDGAGPRRLRGAGNYLAFVPFLAYVGLFLIVPTLIVATGAFTSKEGGFTLDYVSRLFTDETFVSAFIKSIQLAVGTAILGAVFGALLAWAVARGDPNGQLRQVVVAASGVLAQFGGVMLAFAFLATFAGHRPRDPVLQERPQRPGPLRLDLAVRADRPRRRLRLLPDPADGDRVPALARRPPPGVVRRVGQPRRVQPGLLAARRRTDPGAELPGGAAAAVHQRLLGLRDGRRAHQPGQPDRHAPDLQQLQSEVVLGQENVGKASRSG